MNTRHITPATTKQQIAAHAALHDAAKLRAAQLRQQAINELWSGAGRVLRWAWLRAVSRSNRRSLRSSSMP